MNKLLQRQLHKYLGQHEPLPDSFNKLLNVISESYDHYEKDRRMMERSIELSSKEMIELNNEIRKNGKAELEKAHKQLKNLLEDISEVLYSVDMISYQLVQMSAACEKIYGYSSEEFFTNADLWNKVIHPDDKHISEQQVQLLYQGKQVKNEYRIIHKNGSIRWVENKIIPTIDTTGKLIRIDGVTNDISERKKAEKELEELVSLLEATIESTADGILVADFNGKIVKFNKKFVELSRIPREIVDMQDDEKAMSFVLNQLANPEEFITKVKELYLQKEAVSFDIIKFKDNRTFERYSQPQLIKGKCVGRVWSFRDITDRKIAEDKIKESEEQYKALVENAPEALVVMDVEKNKFLSVSESAVKLFKMSKESLLKIGPSEVSPEYQPDGRLSSESAMEKIKDAVAGNKPVFEWTHCDVNGNLIPCEVWLVRMPSEKNVIIRGSIIDISERKKAETVLKENEGQLSVAAQIAKLGYWEFDVMKGLFIFNDQFYAIFKTTAEKMGGYTMTPDRYASLFVYPEDAPIVGKEVADAINSPDSGYNRQIEHRIIYANGEIGYMAVRFFVVKDEQGRTIKTFGANQDITDRKKGEETLRISEVNLELKNKELELKNKELEQFAYVASHDLQEPLRTTSSFAELLQQQYKGKLDEKADKYLTFINQSSDRMKVLIKDLLDYSRIGRKKEVEQVDCNTILQGVLADLDVAIKEAKADIKFCKLPILKGYATEIKQLFQNLIINAIKFRKQNESPRINICAKRKNDQWEFSFNDNGIGISSEHSDRIFVIFQRLHTRNEYEGSGIGLAHCKKIVELHGGKIWVKSNVGEGSKFYFTL